MDDEVIVKKMDIVDSAGDLQAFQIIPNFASLGPKFRKESNSVINEITNLDEKNKAKVIKSLRENLDSTIMIGKYKLEPEDLKLKVITQEGFQAEEFKEGLLILNIDLSSNSLVKEGLAKDIIRRIQSMRKDLRLEYDSEIELIFYSNDLIAKESIEDFKIVINSETLSNQISFSDKPLNSDKSKDWEVTIANGEKVKFSILIKN